MMETTNVTRINVGIFPYELCDAHLIAEARELPRMAAFAKLRFVTTGLNKIPIAPTLSKGHMAFFLPYGLWLKYRHDSLKREMRYRGFTVKEYDTDIWADYPWSALMPPPLEEAGRPLLISRIRDRLLHMKVKARWTSRVEPEWSPYFKTA
jgi:hypothetical protein